MTPRRSLACTAALLAAATTVLTAVVGSAAPTRHEAEVAPATCDGAISSAHAGFSGSGFCDGTNAVGAAAQFTVNASASGEATVSIRFANGGTTARAADILVNGARVTATSFDSTGAWTTWVTKTLQVPVTSGSNTIRISATSAAGLPNVDYLEVDAAGAPTPTRQEAETAPSTCDGLIESNYPGYSGTGFCNSNNAVGAAAQFTITPPAAGSVNLSVRFANGSTTARPADVVVNGATVRSVSFEGTGAWSTWATKTVPVTLNSGSNTIRLRSTTASGLPNVDFIDLGGEPTQCSTPIPTVWLAGDSTMAPPSGGTVSPAGWGSQFAPYFDCGVTIKNRAVGGRSIQTWLYDPNVTSSKNSSGECIINPARYSSRWMEMLDAANGMKSGDYLIIQFGINDGSSTCPRHVGSARYQQLLGDMARAAKARGAHPIFLTPVSAIRCSGSTAVATRGFLNETNSAASANQVPVIDLHRLSYTLYNTLRFCPHNGDFRSGPVGAFFANDHTHFEPAGARQIAGVVAKAIRDQRIPLAAYLK